MEFLHFNLMILLLFVPPTVLFGWGVWYCFQVQRWMREARRVNGQLVGWEDVALGDKTIYKPIIEFAADDGKTYRVPRPIAYSRKPENMIGSRTILYSPQNPSDAREDTANAGLALLGSFLPALIVSGVCYWIYYDFIKK